MHCKYKSNMTKKKAFTLIELLIVIAIIGILFIVLVSKVDFASDKAKASGVQTDFRSFQVAFEMVSKENAGFNTFGWDTGDNAGSAPAGYTYENADKDKGDRIRNSYDEGDANLNGQYDDGEVWTGRKIYTETWTGCYTLINPGNASDMSAIFDLETAINKNLDPKLHINIADDGVITMANGLKDPWSTQYHGRYITNASADAAAKWNTDASMAGSTGDNMDRGAILMYSNGANQKFGTKVKIEKGVVTATVSQIDANHPDNNKMGADDYVLAVMYSYTNGYGETAAITEGFSNNQQFLTGNGGNVSNSVNDNNHVTEETSRVLTGGLYETGTSTLKLSWDELLTQGIINTTGAEGDLKLVVVKPELIDGDLHISNGVTSIMNTPFQNNTVLTGIFFPKGFKTLNTYEFKNCTSLQTVVFHKEAEIQYVSSYYFNGCTSLKEVVLPSSITKISKNNFGDNIKLEKLYYEGTLEQYLSIKTGMNTNNGNSYHAEGWGYLTDELYINGELIEHLIVPEGITSFSHNAFEGWTWLKSVQLPNSLENISTSAFAGCTSLTEIVIPNNVKQINDWAFAYCNKLETVRLSESLESIGDFAFTECKTIKSLNIPNSLQTFGSHVFNDYMIKNIQCNELNNGKYLGNNTNPYVMLIGVVDNSVSSFEFASNTKFIHDGAFEGCSQLSSIDIPESVVHMGHRCFYGTAIESIELPKSLTYLGVLSFLRCNNLTNVLYKGTIAELTTATKVGGWYSNFYQQSFDYIQCSDGQWSVPKRT